MIIVYIDYPVYPGSYDFRQDEQTGAAVVSRMLGHKAKFVVNSCAKISKGDVYEIYFENDMDATAFMLQGDYEIIPLYKIKEYIDRRNQYQFYSWDY